MHAFSVFSCYDSSYLVSLLVFYLMYFCCKNQGSWSGEQKHWWGPLSWALEDQLVLMYWRCVALLLTFLPREIERGLLTFVLLMDF